MSFFEKRVSILLTIVSLVLLSACTTPMQSAEMLPHVSVYDELDAGKFANSMEIGNVTTAQGVGGMYPITSEEFRNTLSTAMRLAGVYSKSDYGKYIVNANLLKVEQPMMGFNVTVNTSIEYLVTDAKGNEKYRDTLRLPCSKTIGDAFNFETRLRLATGCSVGENVAHFLRVIED